MDAGESITIRPNMSGKLWSQDPERWRALRSRAGCPLCQGPGPPEEDLVAETDSCWVTAAPEAALPGYVCVTTKAHPNPTNWVDASTQFVVKPEPWRCHGPIAN